MNILDYFPAGLTPRPEQAAMLTELAQNWMHYDVFAVTAGTGVGKTELGLTIARWQASLGFGTNIVMPNNGLVTQTLQRYPDTPVLHKQADYTCESFGDCKSGRTAQQHACKGCPYVKAKAKITRSKVRLMNYHIYWAHKLYAPNLVCDESHKLLDLFSSTREHYIWHSKYKFPTEMRVVSDAVKWAQAEVKKRDDPKLETFLIELLRMNAETEVEYEEAIFRGKDDIKLKVYNVTNSGVPPWLWPPHRVRKIVLMSATIGMEDIKELGLDKRRVKLIECNSPIPPERRMLICDPYVTMRHDVMDHAIPRLVTKIRETLAKHPEKGLIHAPYALAEKLRAELDDPRLIFHTKANKAAKLAEFRRAPEGAVLVASGMYEGIDLPYDAARWQIISRVPYPSLGAVSVRMRKDINSDWYAWQAVKAIIQATGRITRAADDFGVTYIFDTNFVNLLQRDDKRDTPMFPRSNRAAIKVV